MTSVVRWIAGVATTVGLALGGVVVALVVLPTTQAHALTCDTAWKTATSGDWSLATNWTGGVPTSSTNACITLVGTYTVTINGIAAQAKTITLGNPTGATGQTLAVTGVGCGTAASLNLNAVGSTVKKTGVLQLTSTLTCGGNPAALNVNLANTLINTGVIDIEPGNGGARSLLGQITNKGIVTVNANTDLPAGTSFTNQGAINIADAITVTVDAVTGPPTSTFFNDTGGKVNSSGVLMTGVLYMNGGNNFNEGAGTTNNANTFVDGSALSYTGSGASQIIARDTGTLTGAPSAGQSLTIQGVGCVAGAAETLTGSATNAGTLTLSATPTCGGGAASLTVGAGTLTNTGTLDSEPGSGGARTITGAVTSSGTFTVNANTTMSGSWDNKGAITIADNLMLSVLASSSSTFTNDTGGSVNTTGSGTTGNLYMSPGNTFVEGAGTTTGGPAYVDGSALSYTGSGASQIIARETGTLTGAPGVGQGLTLQGTGCVAAVAETLTGSATNAGTITLTATPTCGGNNDTLTIPAGSLLTNNGTLSTLLGNGGTRTITGDITNSSTGSISIAAKTTYKPATLFTNQGAVLATAPLAIANVTTSVVYDSAGSMKGPISINKGTFKQGNGVLKTPVGVSNATTDFVGTGKGTVTATRNGVLEGTLVSGQLYTLQGAGCGAAVAISTSGAVVNGGTITLTANAVCSGNSATLTIPAGSSLLSSGTIVTKAGNGGARTISGSVTNTGAVSITTSTSLGGTWDNKGSVTIADSVVLSLPASAAATFTNDTGGSVVTTGDASTGDLLLSTGNTLVEGAGTTSGGPVYLDNSALSYTGSGSSQIIVRGAGTLAGAPSAGQVLTIQGTGCSEPAVLTAAGSFTNHGTIILSADSVCGGNSSALTLPGAATLTNSGTLRMAAGNGGARTLNGNLDNKGTVGTTDGPALTVSGNFTNEAVGTVAVSVPTATPTLTISGTATISGGTLKAVPQTGATFTPGQMFPALSAGTVTGTFTTVTGGPGQTWAALYTPTTVTLNYVGP